ncbi:MAG: thioredoxin family protein [Planctomycetaceae bacterium]
MRSSLFQLWLVGAVAAAIVVRAAEPTAETVWLSDFTTAQTEAQKLNRPLVVHFYTRWCGPCRTMEREVLNTPQVVKLLEDGFVAVKVDVEKAPKVQAKYRVEHLPTDMILGPDGKVLHRSEGFELKSGDKQKYVAALAKTGPKPIRDATQKLNAAPQPRHSEVAAAQAPRETLPESAQNGNLKPAEKLVPDPIEPQRLTAATGAAGEPAQPPAAPTRPVAALGLDGYCPVTLRLTRTWKSGQKDVSLDHEGLHYQFASAEKREQFKSNPARYAPKLMGCDPVTLAESDIAIRGSTKFGAYYDGALFLFESDASRAKFRNDPVRYTKLKHVLKPEEIRDVRNLASATVLK